MKEKNIKQSFKDKNETKKPTKHVKVHSNFILQIFDNFKMTEECQPFKVLFRVEWFIH